MVASILKKIFTVTGPVSTFRNTNVADIIPDAERNADVYVVNHDENTLLVIDKLLNPENRETLLVIVKKESPEKVIGTLSDYDLVKWVRLCLNPDTDQDTTQNVSVLSLAKIDGYESIYVDDTVDAGLNKMNECKIRHIVVKNRDESFYGILCKRHIQKMVSELLRTNLRSHKKSEISEVLES